MINQLTGDKNHRKEKESKMKTKKAKIMMGGIRAGMEAVEAKEEKKEIMQVVKESETKTIKNNRIELLNSIVFGKNPLKKESRKELSNTLNAIKLHGVNYSVKEKVIKVNQAGLAGLLAEMGWNTYQSDRVQTHLKNINTSDSIAFGESCVASGMIVLYVNEANQNFSGCRRAFTTVTNMINPDERIEVKIVTFLNIEELDILNLKSQLNNVKKESNLINGYIRLWKKHENLDIVLSKKECSKFLGYESQYSRIMLILVKEYNDNFVFEGPHPKFPATRTMNDCYKIHKDKDILSFDKAKKIKEILEASGYYLTKEQEEELKDIKRQQRIAKAEKKEAKLQVMDFISNLLNEEGRKLFEAGNFNQLINKKYLK